MLQDESQAALFIDKNALSKSGPLHVPSTAKMFESLKWCKPDLALLNVEIQGMNNQAAIGDIKSFLWETGLSFTLKLLFLKCYLYSI